MSFLLERFRTSIEYHLVGNEAAVNPQVKKLRGAIRQLAKYSGPTKKQFKEDEHTTA
jgi:hypothetical protein